MRQRPIQRGSVSARLPTGDDLGKFGHKVIRTPFRRVSLDRRDPAGMAAGCLTDTTQFDPQLSGLNLVSNIHLKLCHSSSTLCRLSTQIQKSLWQRRNALPIDLFWGEIARLVLAFPGSRPDT